MSAENVELVRRLNALSQSGRWDEALGYLREDVEWRDLMHAPDVPEVINGIDGVRALVASWFELYDEFAAEVLEYVDADPWVICDTRWHGRGKGSGVAVEVRSADAWRVEDGKIAASHGGFPDMQSALDAVGASRRSDGARADGPPRS
jgi:ketosteroid isomerase-like protein